MAVLKAGVIGDVSGRLGSVEVAQVRGKGVLKISKGRKPKSSAATQRAQSDQAAAVRYWQSLSAQYKTAWALAARQRPGFDRFGQTRYLSGFQLFLTIPHDFRYGFTEQWLDNPPLSVTEDAGWAPLTLQPGYVMTGGPATAIGQSWLVSAFVARFQSASSDRGRKVWRKAAFYEVLSEYDFSDGLEDAGYSFILGERVAVRMQSYRPGYWPIWHDYGIVTVTAPE